MPLRLEMRLERLCALVLRYLRLSHEMPGLGRGNHPQDVVRKRHATNWMVRRATRVRRVRRCRAAELECRRAAIQRRFFEA